MDLKKMHLRQMIFWANTCKAWEDSISPVLKLSKRLAIFRFGIVLSKEGGALSEFKKSLKFGVAAILGNGKQIISWIHIDDLCRLLLFAIEHEYISGVYNAVAPQPVSNKSFTLLLAKTMRGKFFIPVHVPVFALKLRLGEMSVEVLKSCNSKFRKNKRYGIQIFISFPSGCAGKFRKKTAKLIPRESYNYRNMITVLPPKIMIANLYRLHFV
jgi:uncharacterized protein (TIGR01777 family)